MGVGKTSIALTVLHHNRIKERFGENRRFIRCDQFPPSPPHFLARLSKVIGAGLENPEDLTLLRPFLSSKKMFIILDGAESILDPCGTNVQEMYTIVDELCLFEEVCFCITSRITIVPPCCTRVEIPVWSMEAARDIFYRIHGGGGQSDIVNDLLQRSNFNALSITLLATAASRNSWDHSQLAEEWLGVLRTGLDKTIEFSLTSPSFLSLGTNARNLLQAIACFPRGIDTADLDWLFSTIPDRRNIFNTFRILSLTNKSDGFIIVPAPIRNYLCPRGPKSSPLFCATQDGNPSGPPSSELQSWNVPSDLPSITPVCIGQLTTVAHLNLRSNSLTLDGENLSPDEEWVPVGLDYERNSSEMQETIHIRTLTSAGSPVDPPHDEPLGVVEHDIARKLGFMFGEGSIRLDAKIHKEALDVSSDEFYLIPCINFR